MLEGILEGQMAPQYFPVQTLKNMGATIEIAAIAEGKPFEVAGCRGARPHQPARAGRRARVSHRGRRAHVVYASDAGYGARGRPSRRSTSTAAPTADPRQHLHARGPARATPARGFSSVEDAVTARGRGRASRRLVLFHYDQDYSDAEVDALCRARPAPARQRGGTRYRARRRRRRRDPVAQPALR